MVYKIRKEIKKNKMKDLIKLFLSLTLTFILLLQFEGIRFTNIYFFDGIYLLITSSIINFFIFRKRTKNLLITLIAVLSINFGFFVLFPVSYERSVSVSLLNNLSEENINSFITREQLQNEIKNITNNDMFLDKRINEQLYTGYIEEVDGKYILTNRIKNFVMLQNLISILFNTN